MVKAIGQTGISLTDRVENAFNAVGKYHIIGIASGALRAATFTLKGLADVVSYLATAIFSKNKTLEADLKNRLVQDFKNIALGVMETIPVFGVIKSRRSVMTGVRKHPKESSMAKVLTKADRDKDKEKTAEIKALQEAAAAEKAARFREEMKNYPLLGQKSLPKTR